MKRYIVYGMVICMAAALLTGCGGAIPDMTAEQQTQVTEYAVNTLLKYSKSNNSRLVISELEKAEEIVEEPVEPEPEPVEEPEEAAPEPAVEEEAPEETAGEEGTSEAPVYSAVSMNEFLGLQNVSIDYRGCRIADSYPDSSENAYFSMTASQGKKLLVLEFEIKNTGSGDTAVDMNRLDVNYAFSDSGNKKHKLQHTMVMNDIYAYSGNLEPGATEILAGIVELPVDEAGRIDSPALTMTKGDEKVTIRLE